MQKQKQKLIKAILLGISLASPLLWAAPAHAGFWEGAGRAFVSLLTRIVGILANVLSDILVPLLRGILNNLLDYPNYLFTNVSFTYDLWEGAIIVANSFFLLALIIASIAIILRVNTGIYNIKKVLGGFITAVILSNLSFLIVKVLLEVGDLLTNTAYALFSPFNIDKEIIHKYLGLIEDGGEFRGLMGIKVPIIGGELDEAIVSLIILILIFWVLLKLTLILVERMFWLFIMAIVAPIAFALSLLPTTQKLASQWWETVIKWILVFPLTVALISLSVTILRAMPSIDTPQKLTTALSGFSSLKDLVVNPDILLLISGLVILYLAGTVDKMLKIGGSLSGLVATPSAMIATGKKAWTGAYRPVADTITGRTWIGKQMGKAGHRGYDIALGTKPGQKFEGWRQAQKGWVGRVFNPRGEKARIEADRKMKVGRARGDVLLERAQKSQGQLDDIAQNYGAESWEDLPFKTRTNLEKNRSIGNLRKSRNEDRGAAEFFIGKIAVEVPIHQVPSISSLEETALKDPNASPKERAEAFFNIRRVSHSRDRLDERKEARDILKKSGKEIGKVGLDYKKYEPMEKKSKEKEKVDIGEAGKNDEKLIKAKYDLKKAKTESEQISTGSRLESDEIDTIINEEAISRSPAPDVASLRSIETNTLDILESSDVDTNDAGRMGTILANRDVNEPEIQRTVELIINTGMSPKALKIHKKLQEAGKSPENISDLISKIKSAASSEQTAKSEIDSATRELHIDTEGAKETHTKTIKAYITSKSVESGKTQVEIRQELTKEFKNSYELVSDELSINENTAGTRANVLGSDKLEEIIQLADRTGLRMGRHANIGDMREKATLGELAAMLRRGRATTKDIKFET